MNGLAVVPKGLLGEAFRHPCDFGAFGPCVTVAVQRNAGDAELAATLPKLRRPVPVPHGGQINAMHDLGILAEHALSIALGVPDAERSVAPGILPQSNNKSNNNRRVAGRSPM